MASRTLKSLQAAIACLYSRFKKYKLHQSMEGCQCCVNDADKQMLHSVPLRELTPRHLGRYARKALTTWGNSQDFRHILPRLLELLTYDALEVETEIVLGKLSYAEWLKWPQDEQAAVNDFLEAWWIHSLDTVPDPEQNFTIADEVLCAIGQAVDDLAWYLKVWLSESNRHRVQHLALYICDNYPSLSKKQRLSNAFWNARECQRRQVEAWHESDVVREALRKAVSEYDDLQSDSLLQALDYLEWLEPSS